MAFNGSGLFNRLYNWVTDRNANIPITASRMDAEMDGMATGLSNCITKDGQTTPTANIPLGDNKITDLANGTSSDDAAAFGQIDTGIASADFNQWPSVSVNGTDSEHDIDFAAGKIADSTGSVMLDLTSALTKQIDSTWASGDDAGGMFSGASLAADTKYYCFIIEADADGSIDAGFDTSESAANIPTGYTEYRKIYSFETDGSSNIDPDSLINELLDDFLGEGVIQTRAPVTASGSTIDFTDIPATAKKITIPIGSISSSSSSAISVVLGDSGGFETTGYVGVISTITSGTSETAPTTGFVIVDTTTAAQAMSGVVVLAAIDLDGGRWALQSTMASHLNSTLYVGSGQKALSGPLDRIRLVASAGTFDNGTVNILIES